MKNIKVSIIVPIYNASKYLNKTLSCVINQRLKEIEIILVNDGSIDDSEKICKTYQKKDTRIKYIYQKNAGVSAARNTGLKIAAGEYVGFVDADDEIENDYYEILYTLAKNNDADIVCTEKRHIGIDGRELKRNYRRNISTGMYSREEMMSMLLNGKIDEDIYTKIYKRNAITNVKFIEGKRINEDKYFLLCALENARKIFYYKKKMYRYVYNAESVTHRGFSYSQVDYLYFADKIEKDIEKSFHELSEDAQYNTLETYLLVAALMYADNATEKFKEIKDQISNKVKQFRIGYAIAVLTPKRLLLFIELKYNIPIYSCIRGKKS